MVFGEKYRCKVCSNNCIFLSCPPAYFFSSFKVLAEPLEVGALHFPPFYVVKSHDYVEGKLMVTVAEILKRASINYVVKSYPPKRLYQNVANGETDIWVGNKEVPVYEGKIIHSDVPVMRAELRVYTMVSKKTPNAKEILQRMEKAYHQLKQEGIIE